MYGLFEEKALIIITPWLVVLSSQRTGEQWTCMGTNNRCLRRRHLLLLLHPGQSSKHQGWELASNCNESRCNKR